MLRNVTKLTLAETDVYGRIAETIVCAREESTSGYPLRVMGVISVEKRSCYHDDKQEYKSAKCRDS